MSTRLTIFSYLCHYSRILFKANKDPFLLTKRLIMASNLRSMSRLLKRDNNRKENYQGDEKQKDVLHDFGALVFGAFYFNRKT